MPKPMENPTPLCQLEEIKKVSRRDAHSPKKNVVEKLMMDRANRFDCETWIFTLHSAQMQPAKLSHTFWVVLLLFLSLVSFCAFRIISIHLRLLSLCMKCFVESSSFAFVCWFFFSSQIFVIYCDDIVSADIERKISAPQNCGKIRREIENLLITFQLFRLVNRFRHDNSAGHSKWGSIRAKRDWKYALLTHTMRKAEDKRHGQLQLLWQSCYSFFFGVAFISGYRSKLAFHVFAFQSVWLITVYALLNDQSTTIYHHRGRHRK